jgi:hypothetical protein
MNEEECTLEIKFMSVRRKSQHCSEMSEQMGFFCQETK